MFSIQKMLIAAIFDNLLRPGASLTSILTWISNYIHYEVWDEITYAFRNCNGEVTSHTLLGILFRIHAGIKVHPC